MAYSVLPCQGVYSAVNNLPTVDRTIPSFLFEILYISILTVFSTDMDIVGGGSRSSELMDEIHAYIENIGT